MDWMCESINKLIHRGETVYLFLVLPRSPDNDYPLSP
jgi:hypothetical protein